ncbi:DUF1376 domain-containing protein [Bradyrhizobium sp. 24]|uniref:YdaU family protein n=1 Tax=unclassified Bradyrhizobium TaxID=2631580 RepID=UPI001FF81DAB|nr:MULTISPECIES: DUF1376 domain-containing protein [unclassified Bradyrhizobium]MCK1299727.1 DUF1376 domain-containing protein [Bradyrhizobium sp. 37]MCK1378094.1 DUF1376 domain-containing protein [Bradyrhizobium sp. 24]MCK1771561.1 DUF1376 domain-containing protein [Bradyrhizobium sp. 134]
MTALPFMPFWVGDFLSSTIHLTIEQRGAFVVLLSCMWQAGGDLPNDPVKLARICAISPKRWEQISPEVIAFFDQDGDRLTQKRLAAQYEKQLEIVEKRRTAGAKGGAAKSLKYRDQGAAKARPNAVTNAHHSDSQPESEPKPRINRKKGEISSTLLQLLPPTVGGGFNAVVERYPRRDSEVGAKKVYDAIIRKKIATELQILEGVDRMQRAWAGASDLRFCPRLVNWLRDQRWNDRFVQGPKSIGSAAQVEETRQSVDTFQNWAANS